MNALFHGDLLNFGTIIIALMIVGGAVVALTMVAQSVWLTRPDHTDQQDKQSEPLEPKRNEQEDNHLPKSA